MRSETALLLQKNKLFQSSQNANNDNFRSTKALFIEHMFYIRKKAEIYEKKGVFVPKKFNLSIAIYLSSVYNENRLVVISGKVGN